MTNFSNDIDWSKTTWEGSRREQLRDWCKLSLRERLLAVEEMAALSDQFAQMRAQGRMQYPNGKQEKVLGTETVSVVQETGHDYGQGTGVNEIVLDGCAPTPLASYLKALGVLRLLSAKYPKSRGFWRGERFVIHTSLDQAGIEHFFLEDYEPTPLVAPWGARSGFYQGGSEKTAREALSKLESSDRGRLQPFQEMIQLVHDLLSRFGIDEKPSDEQKKLELLRICRSELPDHILEWLDTCYLLTGDGRKFPPLLGTGGNEGSGSYVSGFAQQVVACIVERKHDAILSSALFGLVLPDSATNQTPGHFSPSDAGGLNATAGFEENRAGVNPWDYLLTLEGTLLFASAAVRRNADDPFGILSYPFTVQAVCAGDGSYAEGDAGKPRGEIWLPLWWQPASYNETRALLAEGRVALGRKPAHHSLDFVRAVHNLGGYRGIRSYQRYGLLERNGRSYFATPVSRVEVRDKPQTNLCDELDKRHWLDRFRRFTSGGNVANRFRALRKRLEDSIFALSGREPSKAEAQALLTLLGEIQSALAVKALATAEKEDRVPPVPRLSDQWVQAADDDTSIFRIAQALAGLRGAENEPLPLRAQVFPMHRGFDQWVTPDAGEKARIFTGNTGRLTDILHALLERRLWLAQRLEMIDKPLASAAGATADDVVAFLRDDRMDARIAALLPGLCLCEIPQDIDNSAGAGTLPAAFGLLKLALTPDRTLRGLNWLGEQDRLPLPPGMLAQLKAGNHGNRAVQAAWRRLRTSGVTPIFSVNALPTLDPIDTSRATAALMIPLRYGATRALTRQILKKPELEENTA